MTGHRSKVWCCKEQYCIGTWNVRSMNQGKLEWSCTPETNIINQLHFNSKKSWIHICHLLNTTIIFRVCLWRSPPAPAFYCLLIVWTLESKGENVDYTSKNAFTVTNEVWLAQKLREYFPRTKKNFSDGANKSLRSLGKCWSSYIDLYCSTFSLM